MKQETLHVNGFDIVLPVGLPEVLDTPVRDSYQTFLRTSTNDVRRHLTCASTLLPPYIDKLPQGSCVFHAFGGLGATAQIFDGVRPGTRHVFWERDPVCLDYLRQAFPDSLVIATKDSFKQLSCTNLDEYEALMMDMSVGTIKTPTVKPMWDTILPWLVNGPDHRFIWFTDTACHKMHLNYKTYAKDFGVQIEPTAESYLTAYSRWLEARGAIIKVAMREAGEIYAVVTKDSGQRFQSIPYV